MQGCRLALLIVCVWLTWMLYNVKILRFSLHMQRTRVLATEVREIGVTEKHQLLYYLNHRPLIHHTLPQSTHHHFVINSTLTSHRLVFRLTDARTSDQGQGHGGASFRTVVSSSKYLYACPYTDYVNSTYDIVCSWMTAGCYNVSVVLLYMDYGAYRWDGVFINATVWRETVCVSDTVDKSSVEQLPPYTGWMRQNNKISPWKWIYGNRVRQSLPFSESRKCLQDSSSVARIELFGDSHLREFYYCWLYDTRFSLSTRGQVIITNTQIKTNLRFTPTSYVVSDKTIPKYDNNRWAVLSSHKGLHLTGNFSFLSTELDRFLQTRFSSNVNTNNNSTTLVISVGSWDVAFRNISLFVQYSLPALQQFFDAVQKHLDANRMRIVVLTAPAFSESFNSSNTLRPYERGDLRNNAIIAAVNSLINDVIKDRKNVVKVDFFAMTYCHWQEAVDKCHYIKFEWGNGVRRSEVGMAVKDELTSVMCDMSTFVQH